MRRNLVFALALCSALASCTEKKAPLPRAQMANVLRDLHLAESWAAIAGPDSLRSIATHRNIDSLAVYYKTILARHKLSLAQFSAAYEWYRSNPVELDSVYGRVVPMLSELEAKAATGSGQ